MNEERAAMSPIEALREYNAAESPAAIMDLEAEAQARERIFSMPAELLNAPFVVICSIWPEPLESQPFTHGGSGIKRYRIPPGSPEKPQYLLLQNTYDLIIQQEGIGEKGHRAAPIMASQIAHDIIMHWTGDHPGNQRGKKGVGVIRGVRTVAGGIEATPDEILNLVTQQKAFLSFLVERADEWFDNGKREKIGKEHRKALKMLGLDETQHLWVRSKVNQYNQAPCCAERVLTEATVCRHCHTNLINWFIEEDIVPEQSKWPKVFAAIERRKGQSRGKSKA